MIASKGMAPGSIGSPVRSRPGAGRRRLVLRHRRAGHGSSSPGKRGPDPAADEVVDEAELGDDRRVQREGVEVAEPHGAVQAVEREGERQPGLDQRADALDLLGAEVDLDRQGVGLGDAARADRHPEGPGRVQRVDDVEVVGEGLGEVLPRMRGRVGADEALPPVGGRALAVVALQRVLVARPLVAEDRAARLQRGAVADQAVPAVMGDLVPEMAEQRAVGLAQGLAAALALGVVGLRDRDGDAALAVPGHHLGAGRRVLLELEDEAPHRVLVAGHDRQPELQQRVEQPVLGGLHQAPQVEVARPRQVGDGVVMAAGEAEAVALARREQPVARAVLRVAAEGEGPAGGARPRPHASPRPRHPPEARRAGLDLDHGMEIELLRDEAQPVAAVLAARVLESERLPADLAVEELHRGTVRLGVAGWLGVAETGRRGSPVPVVPSPSIPAECGNGLRGRRRAGWRSPIRPVQPDGVSPLRHTHRAAETKEAAQPFGERPKSREETPKKGIRPKARSQAMLHRSEAPPRRAHGSVPRRSCLLDGRHE